MLEKKKILGVGITNSTKQEILEYILKSLVKKGKKLFVVTPNPEFLVLADKDKEYKKVLNSADLALADGVGIIVAGKILKIRLKERVTGVELMKDICSYVAEKPITVGFLGGRHGVAEKTSECLVNKHPKLKIAFVGEELSRGSSHPLNNSSKPSGNTRLSEENSSTSTAALRLNHGYKGTVKSSLRGETRPLINIPKVDILFVAFGAPKQEMWISQNLDKLPVRVAIGVGGSFDYISGRVPRAPKFIRHIGFEWLFRLLVQPWRLKRQLALLEFAFLVLKEKFIIRHSGK